MNKFVSSLLFATTLTSAQEITADNTVYDEFQADPSPACLYCRRMDNNAGFLVSYSYCRQSDECLMDAWNYINRSCKSDWTRGNSILLDDCNPSDLACPEFISSFEKFGSYENTTWSLAAGAKCTVKIDAREGLARVIFAETSYLGIEPIPGSKSKIGDVITFLDGDNEVVIYNGAESGPITILVSFSGAVETAIAATVGLAAASTLLM